MAETVWTEHNVSAGTINKVDHYPLWECKGDQWNYTALPKGSMQPKVIEIIKPIKVRIDNTVDYIRWYFTASHATLYMRVYKGEKLIGQTSVVVTDEEATYCEVTMPRLVSGGEGTIHLLAKGLYQVKADTMKVVAFYEAGWTEHTAPDTEWTEHMVGE